MTGGARVDDLHRDDGPGRGAGVGKITDVLDLEAGGLVTLIGYCFRAARARVIGWIGDVAMAVANMW